MGRVLRQGGVFGDYARRHRARRTQPPREAVRVGEGSKSGRNPNLFRQRGKLVAASLICCEPKGGLMRLMSCDDDCIAIRRSQIGVTRVTGMTSGVADWGGIILTRLRRARRARRSGWLTSRVVPYRKSAVWGEET